MHRAGPGGNLYWDRLAGATAAGLRDRRRHAAVTDLQSARDPGNGQVVDAGDQENRLGPGVDGYRAWADFRPEMIPLKPQHATRTANRDVTVLRSSAGVLNRDTRCSSSPGSIRTHANVTRASSTPLGPIAATAAVEKGCTRISTWRHAWHSFRVTFWPQAQKFDCDPVDCRLLLSRLTSAEVFSLVIGE